MRTVIHKVFWAWGFDKEERWLNEMAAKGLCLAGVGLFRYEFEDCEPGEYKICLELLENNPNNPESVKYIEFLEGTGAQQVGAFSRWVYFRKKALDGDFELFSDNESRIKYLTRLIRFLGVITGLNIYIGFYNLFLFFLWFNKTHNPMNLLGIVNLVIGVFGLIGCIKLWNKRKKLKTDVQIFE